MKEFNWYVGIKGYFIDDNYIDNDSFDTVKNFTPHPINIISKDSCQFNSTIRKWISEKPAIILSIPSSGMLNVKYESSEKIIFGNIPCVEKKKVSIDPIPADCDIAVVSGLYASGSNDPRCHTVIDPVFTPDGLKVIGCLAIGKVIN